MDEESKETPAAMPCHFYLCYGKIILMKDKPIAEQKQGQEAKKMVKEQLEECREDIASLQIERDEINNKIFDPDQVQEILDELTNQLDSLADKMKSGDSWQKDQLARNLFTNLEVNDKKEVSYRVKRPLESLLSERLTEKSRSGDPGGTRIERSEIRCPAF